MKARVYDRINERFNQAGFGALRDRLVADLTGAVLEVGAGTGLNLPRPGGTLEFLEHVRDEGRRGWWQDRFTPLQRWLGDGCHLNRDPVAAMARAGLRVESVDRFVMPSGNPLLHAGVTGRAVKPAT